MARHATTRHQKNPGFEAAFGLGPATMQLGGRGAMRSCPRQRSGLLLPPPGTCLDPRKTSGRPGLSTMAMNHPAKSVRAFPAVRMERVRHLALQSRLKDRLVAVYSPKAEGGDVNGMLHPGRRPID